MNLHLFSRKPSAKNREKYEQDLRSLLRLGAIMAKLNGLDDLSEFLKFTSEDDFTAPEYHEKPKRRA